MGSCTEVGEAIVHYYWLLSLIVIDSNQLFVVIIIYLLLSHCLRITLLCFVFMTYITIFSGMYVVYGIITGMQKYSRLMKSEYFLFV